MEKFADFMTPRHRARHCTSFRFRFEPPQADPSCIVYKASTNSHGTNYRNTKFTMAPSILSRLTLFLASANILVLSLETPNSANELISNGLEALGGETALKGLCGVTYHSPG